MEKNTETNDDVVCKCFLCNLERAGLVKREKNENGKYTGTAEFEYSLIAKHLFTTLNLLTMYHADTNDEMVQAINMHELARVMIGGDSDEAWQLRKDSEHLQKNCVALMNATNVIANFMTEAEELAQGIDPTDNALENNDLLQRMQFKGHNA